jgi:hypothetical protein
MPRFLLISFMLMPVLIPVCGQDTIQVKLGEYPVNAIIYNSDTIYLTVLDQVNIRPRKERVTKRDLRQYRRLVYNVKKVYPYAKLAGEKFGEITAHLQTLEKGKDQREYIKQIEQDIFNQYEEELKDLTITQGRILIKLIDRETSNTSYEVVKELRGGFQAAFWQAIARIFGSNLKVEFDAEGEDKILDEIMVMIEQGQL